MEDRNDILRMYEARSSDIMRALERDGIPFDFDTFEAEMFRVASASSKAAPNVVEFVCNLSAQMKAEGRHGNALLYDSLAVILDAHKPKASLGDITPAWLTRFEHFMRAERKLAPNTMSVNMRTLRATCNRAVKSGAMRADWYPFKSYTIGHLDQATTKRAISMEDFQRIISAAPADREEDLAQDLFAFSLFARGINMVDIANLKRESVRDGRIEYVRKKTHTHYSIALNAHTAALLEKHQQPGSDYCFPILSDFHDNAKRQQERIHRVTVQTNKALRQIATRLGISTTKLSFYAARHTYATALKERGASIEVISEAMGHADLRTTQIYLRSFDKSVLDEADKLLL